MTKNLILWAFPRKFAWKFQVTIADLQFPYLLFKALFNNLFNNFLLNYFSNKTFGFTNKLVDQDAGSLISSYHIHSQSQLLLDHMQFVEQDIYIIDVLWLNNICKMNRILRITRVPLPMNPLVKENEWELI